MNLEELIHLLKDYQPQKITSAVDLVGIERTFLEIKIQDEISAINVQKFLTKNKLLFHCISTGCNWGLGSNFPPSNVHIVLNLCFLNKILDFNDEVGYITIQAGVTQEQLYSFLNQKGKKWMLDVTGSGKHTSVLGNSLARGIDYSTYRAEKITQLTAIDREGNKLITGFPQDLIISKLYKWGIGPDYSGIFFQSTEYIVISATFKLNRKPEHKLTVHLKFKESNLALVCQQIIEMQEENILACNPHLMNPERVSPVLTANIMKHADSALEKVNKLVDFLGINDNWSGGFSISGSKEMVYYKKKEVKKRLKKISSVQFMSDQKVNFLSYLFKSSKLMSALLKTLKESRGLSSGVPTDFALSGMTWPSTNIFFDEKTKLDEGDWGAAFFAPVGPYISGLVKKTVDEIERTCTSYGFKVAISVNSPGYRVAEYVISIHYKKNQTNTEKALACIDELNKNLRHFGSLPYRLGSWQIGPQYVEIEHKKKV